MLLVTTCLSFMSGLSFVRKDSEFQETN
jgi:hypothetical protein